MKTDVYNSLAAINQATKQIAEHIELLKTDGLLTPHFAEIRRLAAEQNCSETCLSAILNLANREQEDAARVEQLRMEKEKKLSSLIGQHTNPLQNVIPTGRQFARVP